MLFMKGATLNILKVVKGVDGIIVLQFILGLLLATIVVVTFHPHGDLQVGLLACLVSSVALGCQGRAIVRLLVKGFSGPRDAEETR